MSSHDAIAYLNARPRRTVEVRSFKVMALGVGVVMAKGANILDFGKAVGAAKDEFMRAVPQGIDIEQIADQPRIVDHAIYEFLRSFAGRSRSYSSSAYCRSGRTGIVVALSVPLVLAITFVVMAMLGIDLHRITLRALIIALGLLVDDAIIAVEMMVVKIEQGWDRMRAAAFAWTSTAFPMLTGPCHMQWAMSPLSRLPTPTQVALIIGMLCLTAAIILWAIRMYL